MKAIVYETYGPPEVLHLAELPTPTPQAKQVLVRVKAVAVTAADARIRQAKFPKGFSVFARLVFGVRAPRRHVLGGCYSGVVEAVGPEVTDFQPGDEVCGTTGIALGCYAEFIEISTDKNIVKKSPDISHEQAAGVLFGGTTALSYLRDKLRIMAGEAVLVNGASGAVGTNAIQLAKHFGTNVTGVTSGKNTELIRSLGADEVIDYTQTDVARSGQKYDAILDTVGTISLSAGKQLLKPGGRLGLVVATFAETLRAQGPVKAGPAPERKEDIQLLLALVEQGKLQVVIDEIYEFADVVAAHQHLDTGHKVGNIILRVN